eukprot:scaffold13243_cov23-Tisochrysis_lutea.AAC.1
MEWRCPCNGAHRPTTPCIAAPGCGIPSWRGCIVSWGWLAQHLVLLNLPGRGRKQRQSLHPSAKHHGGITSHGLLCQVSRRDHEILDHALALASISGASPVTPSLCEASRRHHQSCPHSGEHFRGITSYSIPLPSINKASP